MVVLVFNPSMREAEAHRFSVSLMPDLQSLCVGPVLKKKARPRLISRVPHTKKNQNKTEKPKKILNIKITNGKRE